MSDKCATCQLEPCICKCALCNLKKEFSYYADGENLLSECNLTMDSIKMEDGNLSVKLLTQGWQQRFMNNIHFRFRLLCRPCMVQIDFSRQVWKSMNKDTASKDTYQPNVDEFYSILAGTEVPSDRRNTDEDDYYQILSD